MNGLSEKDAFSVLFRDYPDVVTVEQMARMLGISTKTAYRLLQEGQVRHFMIGRAYRIPKLHIIEYLQILETA